MTRRKPFVSKKVAPIGRTFSARISAGTISQSPVRRHYVSAFCTLAFSHYLVTCALIHEDAAALASVAFAGGRLIRIVLVACAVAVFFMSSCIVVPYPMPKRIESRTPSKDSFDFTFIHPGTTKREEVEQKLAPLASGTRTPGLFWGRFISSKVGVVAAGGVPYGGGGAVAGRGWSDQNLWVFFDDSGVVTGSRVISDSQLDGAFAEWFGTHPRALQLPLRLEVTHGHRDFGVGKGQVIFEPNQIRYEESSCEPGGKNKMGLVGRPFYHPDTCDHHFIFSASDAIRIHGESLPAKKGDDRFTRTITVQTRERKLNFYPVAPLTADELLDILGYLSLNRSHVKYR